MLYDCCRNFVSFYSQSMIEFTFTFTLHNAVARESYLTIQSATFTVDIDGFQTDWQLICMSNALILLKELTMSSSALIHLMCISTVNLFKIHIFLQ